MLRMVRSTLKCDRAPGAWSREDRAMAVTHDHDAQLPGWHLLPGERNRKCLVPATIQPKREAAPSLAGWRMTDVWQRELSAGRRVRPFVSKLKMQFGPFFTNA